MFRLPNDNPSSPQFSQVAQDCQRQVAYPQVLRLAATLQHGQSISLPSNLLATHPSWPTLVQDRFSGPHTLSNNCARGPLPPTCIIDVQAPEAPVWTQRVREALGRSRPGVQTSG